MVMESHHKVSLILFSFWKQSAFLNGILETKINAFEQFVPSPQRLFLNSPVYS